MSNTSKDGPVPTHLIEEHAANAPEYATWHYAPEKREVVFCFSSQGKALTFLLNNGVQRDAMPIAETLDWLRRWNGVKIEEGYTRLVALDPTSSKDKSFWVAGLQNVIDAIESGQNRISYREWTPVKNCRG